MSRTRRLHAALVALCTLALAGAACVVIDPREVCVKTRLGHVKGTQSGVDGNPLGLNDYHCYRTTSLVYETSTNPFGKRDDNDPGSQADYKDHAIDARTKDGQRIDSVTYSIRFRVPGEQVERVYKEIPNGMNGVVEQVVKFHSRTTVRQVLQQYDAEVINSDRLEAVQRDIEARLRPEFEGKGVVLESFQLRKPDFNDEYEAAINKRQIAEQDKERAVIEALAATERAKGEAAAARERARGEAEAIALVGEALARNPLALQQQLVEAIGKANTIYLPASGVSALLPVPSPPAGR